MSGTTTLGGATDSRSAYVKIHQVTKKFGAITAVDDVSLDIERGEIFCLLGGSGCGKSTLLRMLAGFETPNSGTISIDGVSMADVPPYERPVNMMFQSYALFPHMTVAQNVAFGLKQESLRRSEIKTRVAEMLAMVKLQGFEQRKPHQLSGGQRQRVALARSLVKRPKLLLLDEPLGALDAKLREYTQFELLNIQHRLGITFIVVTHDQEEAMTLATRIGVMNQGRIVQIGAPREIYEAPSSRFVAEFIGAINIFEGKLVETSSRHARIACPDLGCEVHVDRGVDVTFNARVSVAIRPEKIELAVTAVSPGTNCTSGVVQEIAYMGDASVYLIELGGGQALRVTQPNIRRDETDAIIRGQRVSMSWHASSPVVFAE